MHASVLVYVDDYITFSHKLIGNSNYSKSNSNSFLLCIFLSANLLLGKKTLTFICRTLNYNPNI